MKLSKSQRVFVVVHILGSGNSRVCFFLAYGRQRSSTDREGDVKWKSCSKTGTWLFEKWL